MNIARSFSHPFKDASWFFKVFIGGLFLLLSVAVVGCPFILGYQARHVAAVGRHEDTALPEWKDMAELFKHGTIIFFALAIYLFAIVSLAAGVFGLHPRWLVLVLSLMMVLFIKPLVLIQFARRRTFLSCFRIHDMISSFLRHPISFSSGLVVSFLVTMATFLLGWMSLILGWPFVAFWGIIVESHIAGQLADL